jgi:hypothetical protein
MAVPNLNRILFGIGAVLGTAALIGVLIFLHTRAVSKYGDERYQAGKADAYAAVEHKAHELELKANALAAQLRERNDAENRTIAADGADLRLRGPGKAVCTGSDNAAPAASGHDTASRPADAPMVKVPYPAWATLAAVPWDDTTAFAEQCDANAAEVKAWRAQREGTK